MNSFANTTGALYELHLLRHLACESIIVTGVIIQVP